MTLDISIEIISPLLILVSLNISSAIRDEDIEYPLYSIGTLHIGNSLIFLINLSIVILDYDGGTMGFLLYTRTDLTNMMLFYSIAITWIVAPLLEIPEYREIWKALKRPPRSLIYHLCTVVIILTLLILTVVVDRAFSELSFIALSMIFFIPLLSTLVASLLFINRLQKEHLKLEDKQQTEGKYYSFTYFS